MYFHYLLKGSQPIIIAFGEGFERKDRTPNSKTPRSGRAALIRPILKKKCQAHYPKKQPAVTKTE